MDKKTLLGILIGAGATYLFLKMKKKPCGCNGDKAVEVTEDMAVDVESGDDLTCEQAVDEVMKSMRFASAEMMEQFREQELEKCRNS